MSSGPQKLLKTPSPPVVGIIGGIGSGKSSVVRQVNRLNLLVVDADKIGHQLLNDVDVSSQICSVFGKDVIDSQGQVCRRELARRVFGDTAEQNLARKSLEQILHPAIRQEIHRQIDHVSKDIDAIILDAALLLETGWDALCEFLIFVDTPGEVRKQRVIRDRGWNPDELDRRESTQWAIERKRSRADFLVDNSGSLEQSAEQMEHILNQIVSKHTGPSC